MTDVVSIDLKYFILVTIFFNHYAFTTLIRCRMNLWIEMKCECDELIVLELEVYRMVSEKLRDCQL